MVRNSVVHSCSSRPLAHPGREGYGEAPPWLAGQVRKGLLAAQVAVSLVLVVAAVLLSSSLANLRNLEIGVRTDGVRWSRLYAVPGGYRGQNEAAYYPELVRQLSEVPGVESVALASYFPTYFALGDLVSTQSVARAGDDDATTAADGIMENVSPGFFQTVGIPMVRGRDFFWTDDARHPAVAIVNDSLSRAIFPRGDAVGQRIRIGKDVQVLPFTHPRAKSAEPLLW